jgi:FkbM family methyltransferase
MEDKSASWIRSVAGTIYNHLPEGNLKKLLRGYFYQLTSLYALDKMVSRTELLQDGIFFVELKNGAKFYGEQDKVPSRQSIIPKLDKLKDLQHCDGVLGLLCYEYVVGQYEKYYELKKGDIVVDAGAHVGTFSVKAAKLVGDEGKVIAIEPELNNLRLLRKNVEANELRNVAIVPKGVCSGRGKLRLNVSWNQTGHSFYQDDCYGTKDTNDFEEVEIDSIDHILTELGIKRADFIKMDIEGAEIEALKGMNETLKDNDVKLAIEVAHIVDGKSTDKTVVAQLKKKGFEVRRKGEIVYARKRA